MPTIRPLVPDDRTDWDPLWQAYITFYAAAVPRAVSDETWRRFHDPAVPLHILGAFDDGRLVGFATYLFHLSTWSVGPYCYLEDLFTDPAVRGRGAGRALIAGVADAARQAGAGRLYWLTQAMNATARALYDRVAVSSGFVHYQKDLAG